MSQRPSPRRLFVPLVVVGSVLWVALIVASGGMEAGLPQSMGCADPGIAPLSLLRARVSPCRLGAPLNSSPSTRRERHDAHPDAPSPRH